MTDYSFVENTFEPIYNEHSKILILGTLPSVKSREKQFYYGHPQNRFWKVIAQIIGESVPLTIEEKKALLLRNHICHLPVRRMQDIDWRDSVMSGARL